MKHFSLFSFTQSWVERAALVLALSGFAPATFGQTVTFEPVRNPSTGPGTSPRSISVADVNRDGKPDIITANQATSTLSVMLGDGTGNFTLSGSPSSGAGGSPRRVLLGDLNGDGKIDAVTANFNTSTVGVLLGNGQGGFNLTNSVALASGSNPFSLGLTDLNNDNRLDIVTANFSSNNISVLLGDGAGGFTVSGSFSIGPGSNPSSLRLGDFNGDGNADVATANQGTSSLSLLLGNGAGGFVLTTTMSTGTNSTPTSIRVIDVNGDGKLDAITANLGTDNIGVYLGNGAGGFISGNTFSTGNASTPRSVAIADINGDGKLDVITANLGTSTLGVLLGDGAGNFTLTTSPSTGRNGNPFSVIEGDFNNDGKPDAAVANYSVSTLGVLINTTVPIPTLTSISPNSGPANATVTLNGTGLMNTSVITFTGTSNNTVTSGYTVNAAGTQITGVVVPSGTQTGSVTVTTPGGTSNGVTFTLVPAPTLASINPTSGLVGSSVSLSGTNLTGTSQVTFSGSSNNIVTSGFTVANDGSITGIIVPSGAISGPVTVTTPSGTSNGITFTVTSASASDLVVSTGTQTNPTPIPAGNYNSITVTSTGNGVLAGNVSVASFLTVQSGGGLSDGCAIISGAGSFTLASGSTLGICNAAGITTSGNTGSVQVTGTRSYSTGGSYGYTGAAQVTGNGLPATVAALAINTAGDVSLTGPVAISQAVGVGGAGNLVLGGNGLTLLSSASGTAIAVNTGTGVVLGTATVQRYIDPTLNPGTGYRHYSAPVNNTTVADLATARFTPVVNPAYNTSPTPGLVTPFPTVFGYDESRVTLNNSYTPFDRGFFSPNSLSDPLVVGRGYAVNIPASELVDFVGQLNSGDQVLALSRVPANADAGWQLLGNPYPAPLDYSRVAPSDRVNLDAAIYVYSSTGPYVGQYRSYVNGVGDPVLPVAQGFFTRVSAGQTSGSFTFRNSQRLTTPTSTPFQRGAADSRPLVRLELRGANGTDVFEAYTETGATPAFDREYDAAKRPNPTGLNLSSLAGSEALAIDGRPAFTATTTLPLTVGVPAAGTYTLATATLRNLPAGLTTYLTDGATGQTVNLSQAPYAFSVTAVQAATPLAGRFTLHFAPRMTLANVPQLMADAVSLYPNPAHNAFAVTVPAVASAAQVQLELLNSLGQVVRRQAAALPAAGARVDIDATGLASGVYTLRLQAGASMVTKRVVLQ